MYTTLLAHTSIRYEDIGERTIPQLQAIFERLPDEIARKAFVPWFGLAGAEETNKAPVQPDREHTVEEGYRFAALFSGIGG